MSNDGAQNSALLLDGDAGGGLALFLDNRTTGNTALGTGKLNACFSVTSARCTESAMLDFPLNETIFNSVGYLSETAPQSAPTQSTTAKTCAEQSLTVATACTANLTIEPASPGARHAEKEFSSSLHGGVTILSSVSVDRAGAGPQSIFNSPVAPTALGGGFDDPTGVAISGSGSIYVGDFSNSEVKAMPASCASSSCVTSLDVGFNGPSGIAVDGNDNLYVVDEYETGVTEIPAGCNDSACSIAIGGGFNGPEGIAVDGNGNIYVGDTQNDAVKQMAASCASSGCVSTLGGGFDKPAGVAVDGNGNLYVGDTLNHAVKEIPAGCAISTCVITLAGGFVHPSGVAVDANGTVYVADDRTSLYQIPAGCASPTCVAALGGGLLSPDAVALDGSGNFYVADSYTNLVSELNRAVPPALTLASTNLNSSSASQSVTLANDGSGTLTISNIAVTGTNASSYTFSNSCGSSLGAGAACTIHGHFSPVTTGALSAAITIVDNATGSPRSITLSGTGTAPGTIALSSANLDFGVINLGSSSASQSVTLTNTSGGPLSISSIRVTGADASSYAFSNGCGSGLAACANCSIHGHFAPTQSGSLPAIISIVDSAVNSPQSISLSGTGMAPSVSLSTMNLMFGVVQVGITAASQSMTLSNASSAPLSIASINLTGKMPHHSP